MTLYYIWNSTKISSTFIDFEKVNYSDVILCDLVWYATTVLYIYIQFKYDRYIDFPTKSSNQDARLFPESGMWKLTLISSI